VKHPLTGAKRRCNLLHTSNSNLSLLFPQKDCRWRIVPSETSAPNLS